jgi:hypothetical protein
MSESTATIRISGVKGEALGLRGSEQINQRGLLVRRVKYLGLRAYWNK